MLPCLDGMGISSGGARDEVAIACGQPGCSWLDQGGAIDLASFSPSRGFRFAPAFCDYRLLQCSWLKVVSGLRPRVGSRA